MPDQANKLTHPWLVAVWPGMGHVAINGGYYLLAKLGMHLESELEARELFEIEHVGIDKGLIRSGRLPRSRFFLWRDPKQERDLLVFLGEAQPPTGVHAYCRRIIEHARELGVERVITFAAMATEMTLDDESRVFAAATDAEALRECGRLGLTVLEEGQISGLNGVLPGVAAECGLQGICLLGEMPHLFAQLPYPKASLAVLEVFAAMAGLELDVTDLARQAVSMEGTLRSLMERIEDAIREQQGGEEPSFGPSLEPEPEKRDKLSPEDRQHIESLFRQAAQDRSKAYQLKQELDRLEVFAEYEDRFLDLFQEAGDQRPEDPEDR